MLLIRFLVHTLISNIPSPEAAWKRKKDREKDFMSAFVSPRGRQSFHCEREIECFHARSTYVRTLKQHLLFFFVETKKKGKKNAGVWNFPIIHFTRGAETTGGPAAMGSTPATQPPIDQSID